MSSQATPASPGEPMPIARTGSPRWPRPSALEWTLLIAGLLLTNHYAWLLDDAFVYFRYVDNLVLLDAGLVYNRGEFVEGFTSPIWALLLALVRSSGLDYWHAVRLLGLLSFALFWWLLVVLDRDLAPPETGTPAGPPVVNLPLVYLGLAYGPLCYFTSGVETPLVQITAVAYALHFAKPRRTLPCLVVGVSTLVRPELALASALALAFSWAKGRVFPWRIAVAGALGVGGWLGFRVIYYAELLPNTFYLKHLADWAQGLVYLRETLTTYLVLPLAGGAVALVVLLRRRGAALAVPARIAMLVVASAIALYFVRVGGDPRHYRHLAFALCLAACSLAGLGEWALASYLPHFSSRPQARLRVACVGLVFALGLASRYPPQLAAHPLRGDVPHTMHNGINDAAYHRNHTRLAISPWSLQQLQQERPRASDAAGYEGVTNASWCEWAFRLPHMRVIQNLGLTDAILARVEMPADRPAHKSGLQPLAVDIEQIHRRYTAAPGMYRLAVERGDAPDWIARNLDSIEIIERKIYNRHELLENLSLALTFPPRIQP